MKWTFTVVPVTVIVGAVSGVSAANAAIAGPAFIVGTVPAGLATSTGHGLIESVVIAPATGVITVTTRAVVATADMVVNVVVARAAG